MTATGRYAQFSATAIATIPDTDAHAPVLDFFASIQREPLALRLRRQARAAATMEMRVKRRRPRSLFVALSATAAAGALVMAAPNWQSARAASETAPATSTSTPAQAASPAPGSASAQTPAPASQPRAPDTLDARVQGCTACHGAHGEGSANDYFPRLAGKPAEYLYNQLRNFREGRRHYPPMNYLIAYLSDDYLREIATYFSQLHTPYPPPAAASDKALLARGEALVTHGDAARGVPACAACHGAALTGMLPAIPGLVGLHRDYLTAQLGAWRSGLRHALAPDCMHEVATRVSDEDVRAIATWLAAQPAPANPAPAPANSLKTPLACGSEPQ